MVLSAEATNVEFCAPMMFGTTLPRQTGMVVVLVVVVLVGPYGWYGWKGWKRVKRRRPVLRRQRQRGRAATSESESFESFRAQLNKDLLLIQTLCMFEVTT